MLQLSLMIALGVLLSNCNSNPPVLSMPKPPPSTSLGITWQDDGDRLSISIEDAIKLEQWLIDVDFYIYG